MGFVSSDEKYMREALLLAEEAAAAGEVPVGAVIVKNGKVIGRGRNDREENADATGHAEINAIRDACAATGDWRLTGCTIYVTLEPCVMCTGACINARLERIVFGAFDKKAGCCGSVSDLTALHLDSEPDVFAGVLEEECTGILKRFFDSKRG